MTLAETVADTFPTGERGHTRSLADAWSEVSETLVRGLAHALSNRISTIGTIAELLRVDGDDPVAMSEMLGVETRRLEDLLEQMRALSSRSAGRLDAMRLTDAVAGAMSLHSYHPERRAIAITVEPGDESRPVLGDEIRLQRELLILLDAATTAALAHASRALRVRFGLQGRVGVVRLLVGDATAAGALPECAAGAIAMGAEESDAGLCYTLVIPALGAGA
jgi:C4-dicarboxylate-specific signal transduction histidine kinase